MAVVGMGLEKSLSPLTHNASITNAHPTSTTNPHNNLFTHSGVEPKLRLAISLSRVTLYIFIGDAAVAQLLFLNELLGSEAESAPVVFTVENWVQLGLAGSMWLLGALLWVMEPVIYWVSWWRENRVNRGEGRCASWEKGGYFLLSQEDSDVEAS